MGFLISDKQRLNIKQFSIIPKSLLYRIILGKKVKQSSFFITDKDKMKARFVGNGTVLCFLTLLFLLYFLARVNLLITCTISLVSCISFFFVFGDTIRSNIINRHQRFSETAFLTLNALSINMSATGSFPKSIENLFLSKTSDKYYTKYLQNILYSLNLGEDEEVIIEEGKQIFLSKNHQNVFQNIRNNDFYLESDPEFLIKVKKTIKAIEDNIVIFIAVSCLFPLVLSLVLALLLPPDSVIIFVFPLLYAVFGTLSLRLVQNRSLSD
ncbi:MAG: hypothetical protein ACXABK_01275 [Candidatus Heimdallarchaeaceae archaeon]